MPPVPPRRRQARPVADAPIDSLLPRVDDLAKGWLLALVEDAPLARAPAILTARLAREAPALSDAILRAVTGDRALARLKPGGELRSLPARAGELAGAREPAEVSRAVEALRAVLFGALRDELRGADPELEVLIGERLALIAELVRSAALERSARRPAMERPPPAPE
ncbi:MAG: hypothetical protein ACRDMX_06455, partial [Solirubrobacteraceae bacterium]